MDKDKIIFISVITANGNVASGIPHGTLFPIIAQFSNNSYYCTIKEYKDYDSRSERRYYRFKKAQGAG